MPKNAYLKKQLQQLILVPGGCVVTVVDMVVVVGAVAVWAV